MKYYINPIKKREGFADPYVMRYNGRYYLYCTGDDVKCWSSIDLIHWELKGPTIDLNEFPGLRPFAPEVMYWNGAFYMYTSPKGLGHYVLKSDSPTGPFKKVTENFAHNIDGSVLIDDDGQWYFYWADHSGIMSCKMNSPTEFGEPVKTGAYMYGWTEGPFVLKQNGKYYMTYTGNHFLSNGYRINAAVSDHPLTDYVDDSLNPIVLHTEGNNVGLGHSSTVIGPDLKSYYMFYHNINPDRTRDLNLDYQCWHGLSTQVYGPTRMPQVAPGLSDFSDYAENKTLEQWNITKGNLSFEDNFYQVTSDEFICVTKTSVESHGVVESNLKLTGNSESYGILFGWLDMDHFYKVVLTSQSKEVKLVKVDDGKECGIVSSILPDDFDETALHCLRIVGDGTTVIIYIDNRKQLEAKLQSIEGKIGYYATAGGIAIGYTGFSNGTTAQVEKEFYKPVPGEFPACTALGNQKEVTPEGSLLLVADQQLQYHINVEASAEYTVDLYGEYPKATHWKIIVDGKHVADKAFPIKASGVFSINVDFTEGLHTFGLELQEGQAQLNRIGFYQTQPLLQEEERMISGTEPYSKQLWGRNGWSNYIIKAKIKVISKSETGQAGILFRASEPSEGGEGNDPVLGINFFKGYFVGLSGKHISLSKHAYDEQILVTKELAISTDEAHVVTVRVIDDTFVIYLDDSNLPIIVYHDDIPFTHGRVGVRTKNAILEGNVHINVESGI